MKQTNTYELYSNINSKEEYVEIAKQYGDIVLQKDDVSNEGVVEISTKLNIKKYAYSKQHLFPHTDRSSEIIPPKYVVLWYKDISRVGGEALLLEAEPYLNVLKKYNVSAFINSENDDLVHLLPLYDSERDLYRFRNDQHIYIRPSDNLIFNALIDSIKNNSVEFKVKAGDCLVINNHKMLHGRKSFLGDRSIYRILVK